MNLKIVRFGLPPYCDVTVERFDSNSPPIEPQLPLQECEESHLQKRWMESICGWSKDSLWVGLTVAY